MLTAVMFMQQAVKGTVAEFRVHRCSVHSLLNATGANARSCVEYTADQRLVNGLWALFIAFGALLTCCFVKTARSWRLLTVRSWPHRLISVYAAKAASCA
jgi:hypothetical protein